MRIPNPIVSFNELSDGDRFKMVYIRCIRDKVALKNNECKININLLLFCCCFNCDTSFQFCTQIKYYIILSCELTVLAICKIPQTFFF